MAQQFERFAFAAAVMAGVALAALQLLEPLTALGFMWRLGAVDWTVAQLLAPVAIAAMGALAAITTASRLPSRQRRLAWLLVILAIVLGPLLGWCGHALVLFLL